MKAQQEAFLKAMTGSWPGTSAEDGQPEGKSEDEMNDIKRQLAELQEKMAKLNS